MTDLEKLQHKRLNELRPNGRNARTHSTKQIRQIADSIDRFGFTNPVLISDDGEIIAGHGRVEAAKILKLAEVPVVTLSHLSQAERRAYMLADNKLAQNAGWDREMLAIEFEELMELQIDLSVTGFSMPEINILIDEAAEGSRTTTPSEDLIPDPATITVTQSGDLWMLGRHRLVCGDARLKAYYQLLLEGERADLVFTDPPYNVPVQRYVSGPQRERRRKFIVANGELSDDEFTAFLEQSLTNLAQNCRAGAIAYICMDWRHMGELLEAAEGSFDDLKNVCVWNKTNGGTGTFYRSKHELVFVFKVGAAPHVNNFGLGEGGRYRTNVWDYAGVNGWNSSRSEALEMHPTVKPVALVADAIRDCSNRGDVVLDVFAGSGTTLIAAEKCGRQARLIEYDPQYCDAIIRRFERYTGKQARLSWTNETFGQVEEARTVELQEGMGAK